MHSGAGHHRSDSRAETLIRRALNALRFAIAWLRDGYSNEAPKVGHCALIALTGPASLSAKDLDRLLH